MFSVSSVFCVILDGHKKKAVFLFKNKYVRKNNIILQDKIKKI